MANDKDVEDCSPISARAFSGASNRVIGTNKDSSDSHEPSPLFIPSLLGGDFSLDEVSLEHSAEEIQGDR